MITHCDKDVPVKNAKAGEKKAVASAEAINIEKIDDEKVKDEKSEQEKGAEGSTLGEKNEDYTPDLVGLDYL